MAWDSSRPVPWKRLVIEYLVIGIVIAVVALMVSKDRRAANYWTIAMAAPIYLGFGFVLAKLGYARKSLAQVRAEAAAAQAKKASSAPAGASRPKPAPTSRTSTGASNRPNKKKR